MVRCASSTDLSSLCGCYGNDRAPTRGISNDFFRGDIEEAEVARLLKKSPKKTWTVSSSWPLHTTHNALHQGFKFGISSIKPLTVIWTCQRLPSFLMQVLLQQSGMWHLSWRKHSALIRSCWSGVEASCWLFPGKQEQLTDQVKEPKRVVAAALSKGESVQTTACCPVKAACLLSVCTCMIKKKKTCRWHVLWRPEDGIFRERPVTGGQL